MLHLYYKSLTVHVCLNDKVICVVYLSKLHTPLTLNRKIEKSQFLNVKHHSLF